jgi:PAS domain S-box-containing protein
MRSRPGHEGLRQGQERSRLLVESVRADAIFMLESEGHVLTWHAGAQRFEGYLANELVGQHISRFCPAETLTRGLPEHELRIAAETGTIEDAGWRVRKNGSQSSNRTRRSSPPTTSIVEPFA